MTKLINERGQSFDQRVAELSEVMPREIAVDVACIEFGLDPSDTPEIDVTNESDDTQEQQAASE